MGSDVGLQVDVSELSSIPCRLPQIDLLSIGELLMRCGKMHTVVTYHQKDTKLLPP